MVCLLWNGHALFFSNCKLRCDKIRAHLLSTCRPRKLNIYVWFHRIINIATQNASFCITSRHLSANRFFRNRSHWSGCHLQQRHFEILFHSRSQRNFVVGQPNCFEVFKYLLWRHSLGATTYECRRKNSHQTQQGQWLRQNWNPPSANQLLALSFFEFLVIPVCDFANSVVSGKLLMRDIWARWKCPLRCNLKRRSSVIFRQVRRDWRGGFRLGFTMQEPSKLIPESLPSYAVPDLSRSYRFWAIPILDRYVAKNNVLSFLLQSEFIFRRCDFRDERPLAEIISKKL